MGSPDQTTEVVVFDIMKEFNEAISKIHIWREDIQNEINVRFQDFSWSYRCLKFLID